MPDDFPMRCLPDQLGFPPHAVVLSPSWFRQLPIHYVSPGQLSGPVASADPRRGMGIPVLRYGAERAGCCAGWAPGGGPVPGRAAAGIPATAPMLIKMEKTH